MTRVGISAGVPIHRQASVVAGVFIIIAAIMAVTVLRPLRVREIQSAQARAETEGPVAAATI